MRNLNYKLIVSDCDGTLVKKDGTVSKKNLKAIREYSESGGLFVISTGRLPSAILPQARKLGLKGLICCCNGTIILDIESGKVYFDDRLSIDTTLIVCKKMEEMGLHIHAFDFWDYYSNMDDELLKIYEEVSGMKAKVISNQKLSDFLKEKQMCVYKLIALVEPKDNARVLKDLAKENLSNCIITKSKDFLVEVVNDKYSKGSSLSYLTKHYGIELEKTISVGDNCNDISMIEFAGLGIAVKNAEEALKKNANYVCEYTNEESAIAEIIEKFGFLGIWK